MTETKKNKAIQHILDDVNEMSELILWQLRELDNLFSSETLSADQALLDQIRDTEKRIDQFEVKVSEAFISVVCLHKPVASELRKIITCYRLSVNLERIGDQVFKIFKIISEIKNQPNLIRFTDDISHMLTISNNMVEKSILSFVNRDIDNAIWTLKNDDVVDDINYKMIKKIIKTNRGQMKDSQTMSNFIYLKTLFSAIERIADEATNIAEASIYYLKGQDVRHSSLSDLESSLDDQGPVENK